MAEHVYGGKNVLFWVTQIATFAILILAANTAYQGFPGLSSIIARDGYLPRQLANRGDKLVFSNGIIFLAVAAGVLIVVFRGQHLRPDPALRLRRVHRVHAEPGGHGRPPPPTSASRAGGRRWRSTPSAAWRPATVALVVVVSKFTEGAWIPAVLIPALVVVFRAIDRHYRRGAGRRGDRRQLRAAARGPTSSWCSSAPSTRACSQAVQYATSAGPRAPDRRVRRHRPRGAGAAGQGVGRHATSRSRCTRSPRRTGS